ncbi:hypothetical protein ABZ070_36115 [Streptomyces sp. NPDC006283]|uniref:hypothetical protein n=1 Tax=Streptomyces sp. NPDC006283 TaxID=3156741 RepID=UPI0033B827EB
MQHRPRAAAPGAPTRQAYLTDELADAVLRALLHHAAGHDRTATLAARIVVQTLIPAAVRIPRGQVRPFGGRSFDDIGPTPVRGSRLAGLLRYLSEPELRDSI